MADEELYNYVRQNLSKGYSRESIKQALASQGYDSSIVDRIASEMSAKATSLQQPLPRGKRTLTDRIMDNRLGVEVAILIIVVIIAVYVFLF